MAEINEKKRLEERLTQCNAGIIIDQDSIERIEKRRSKARPPSRNATMLLNLLNVINKRIEERKKQRYDIESSLLKGDENGKNI